MEGYIASCDLDGKGGGSGRVWLEDIPEGQDSPLQWRWEFLFKEKYATPLQRILEGSALGRGVTVGYKGISAWLEIRNTWLV